MFRLQPRSLWLVLVGLIGALALVVVGVVLAARLWVEWHWFDQFRWSVVLLRRWGLQFAGAALGLLGGLGLQRWLGWFWCLPRDAGQRRFALPPKPFALALMAAAGMQLLPLLLLLRLAQRLLEDPFDPRRLYGLVALADPASVFWLPAAVLAVIALLFWPLRGSSALAAIGTLALAACLARSWGLWSQALLVPDAGIQDPLLGADVSFGLARFPALAFGLTLLMALVLLHLGVAFWGGLARTPQLSDGRFHGFSPPQLVALRAPLALLSFLVACSFWLGRHQLLMSTIGTVPGAGWLDVHVLLPLRSLGALGALALTLALLLPWRTGRRAPLVLLSLLALAVVALMEQLLAPVLQLLLVRPRELDRETPYLARSIAATRAALGLDRITTRNVNPRPLLTREDLKASAATLYNIRLWDSQPLLATNRQLQQLRVYYRFSAAAVDRYSLGANPGLGRQQVMITARELDQASLPPAARTWLNRHLVFTHGYGFTVSPVNTAGPDGLPDFFIRDLGASTRIQGNRQLGITEAEVRAAIPLGQPSLYFGALPSPYALAPTRVREFDYPQGDENVYVHYQGGAGVPVGGLWGRLASAIYLQEPKLMMQGALTRDTRLLLRREVRERVRRVAPFLRVEGDPYLVSLKLDGPTPFPAGQHQFWIVEGFTSSRTYPYSAPVPGNSEVRYLRNAVKAVVDAYTGRMVLYVAEPADPLIRAWQRLFPELFAPLSAMPPALQAHLRYPLWQFELQTRQLLRYHVTDPRVFYSGDDVWQVPKEIYGGNQVPVKPYHVSAQLAATLPPEFLLLQPLTPLARPNLAGWLAARSDAPHYGQLVLLRFPTQTPIFGPEQITALINQNPRISQQFGLWDRSGSEVIEGNLLVVPVGQALLYVEPIYLKARDGGLPTLTRVVVSDGTRIAMEPTLEKAIESLLTPGRSQQPSLPIAP
ncbi:MAG: UPF0182 family protein [Cyanobacteriota bacterium]|nr:UPF0182 family protein [Cyanobacteriota bacterium]